MNNIKYKLRQLEDKINLKVFSIIVYAIISAIVMIIVAVDYVGLLFGTGNIFITALRAAIAVSCSYNVFVFIRMGWKNIKKLK